MAEQDTAAMLAEFHAALGQPYGHGDITDEDLTELRKSLHREENRELVKALETGDLIGVAHELADVVYVAYGTAHVLGIPLAGVLAEVHRANMQKFGEDGRPTLRADGKVQKPPGWRPANVAAVLGGES